MLTADRPDLEPARIERHFKALRAATDGHDPSHHLGDGPFPSAQLGSSPVSISRTKADSSMTGTPS